MGQGDYEIGRLNIERVTSPIFTDSGSTCKKDGEDADIKKRLDSMIHIIVGNGTINTPNESAATTVVNFAWMLMEAADKKLKEKKG